MHIGVLYMCAQTSADGMHNNLGRYVGTFCPKLSMTAFDMSICPVASTAGQFD
jgi:hypothetical protein